MSNPATTQEGLQPAPGIEAGAGGVGDFFELLKPRVMSLVVFTSIVGLVSAPGDIHWFFATVAVICIAVGAGASGALNMWYEADLDARMARTRNRPIPAGNVTPGEALGFGLVMAAGSVLVMGLLVNYAAAALLAFTIFFYVVIYTMILKRRTPQNIVIGGASGALPPVIGWAAVTGSLAWEPILLFAIIFMWTPPHFWALALVRNEDYQNAGIPMMPVVAGTDSTRKQILTYGILLTPLAVAPWLLGMASIWYGAASIVLGLIFVGCTIQVYRAEPDTPAMEKAALRLFAFSILYLFLLFAILLAEQILGLV